MRLFDINQDVLSIAHHKFGVVLSAIPNLKSEYLYSVRLENGNSVVLPQDELCPAVWTEKYDAELIPVTYMNALRIGDLLGKKNKPVGVLAVGGNEGEHIPHFHIFNSTSDWKHWKGGTCVMFRQNRYFDHGKHNGTLSKEQFDAMVRKLNEKGVWKKMIDAWNSDNPDYDPLPLDLEMPDYSYATIEHYKE